MPLFGPPNIESLEAKRDVQGLIKALAFRDPQIRLAAVEALAPMRDPLAVEPMAALLTDESARIRQAVVAALAERGGLRVVEPLIRALSDMDPDVRAAAAGAVYRRLIADPDAETRRATVTGLGQIQDRGSVEALIKSVNDPDDGVRVAAIKALGSIGDPAAIVPLIFAQAREASRQKLTGRSSVLVERAAVAALDVLTVTPEGMETLKGLIKHDDSEIRELAGRRLSRIGSPEVVDSLVAALRDKDLGVSRAAARGLSGQGWKPPTDETGALYWAALRDWGRCADSGQDSVAVLVKAFDRADALERPDILAALARIGWVPAAPTALAAHYWASQNRWDKCVEMGEPAIEVLQAVVRSSPHWRERVSAAAALSELGQPSSRPFGRIDLVQAALAILDEEAPAKEKHARFQEWAGEAGLLSNGDRIEQCKCGYPTARMHGRESEILGDLLGAEEAPPGSITYYCPGCDTRHSTVAV